MQTRQQTTRQRDARSKPAVSAHRQATRSTRQTAASDTLAAGLGASSAPQRGPANANGFDTNSGSLVKDPAPRRGAPLGKAVSVMNIRARNGDESDDDEAENDDIGKPDGPRDSPSGGLDSNAEDEAEMQQAMEALLPDLKRRTDDLKSQLKPQDSENKAFRVILQTKREALTHLRGYFQEAGTRSSLIDWNKPGALCNLVQTDKSAINILARANLVATLDYIHQVESKSYTNKRDFLQTLDTSFPDLFQPLDLHKPCPQLVLDIRTCYLIEMLASIKGKPRAREAIARIFCQADGKFDYASLCANGPYRRLGGDDEEDHQRCSAQIARLLTPIDKARKNLGLETLRQEFALSELWGQLKLWITGICDEFDRFEKSEYRPSEQDDSDSSEDEAEEPERLEEANAQEPFPIAMSSILELEATKSRASANRPTDDRHMSNGDPPPAGPSSCGLKRPHHEMADDGEGPEANGEGESDFQQDKRQVVVHRFKVPTLEPWPTRVKTRHRVIGELRLARASENPSSAGPSSSRQVGAWTSAPPAPNPSRSSASGEPLLVLLRAAYTRRTAWTDHDAEILVKLIGEMDTFYAGIERECKNYFEYPRGQQAYRDKARNLKVDFLLADQRLPLNFDHVSLGPKEIRKLESAGKNPYRKENDVDAQGWPTNTAWLE